MNPLLEPVELHESECNAHGLYALPEVVFGRVCLLYTSPSPRD